MEHLFGAWQSFADDYRKLSHLLLLSDYDGTLTAIVGRPEDAVLSPEVRQKLTDLTHRPGFTVGVISGRSLAETKSMTEIDGIYYAGNHGMEIEGPGLRYISPEAERSRSIIKELAARLAEALESINGTIIQDKGLSLSVHYRLVNAEEEPIVAETVSWITESLVQEGKTKVFSGKKVWEIRPPIDWDKGKAVASIRREILSLL